MSRQGWSDAYGSGSTGRRLPVRCVKCADTHVILTKTGSPGRGGEVPRWRYTCLDCRVAWWVDEHGGALDDYA
ncbi:MULTISPECIES: hypothetical protein [unclassified Streptomyces]|uniref:Uncharacterized protein n=1 Tax=Streptomyces evansiae TaxID=3075535 RepID=A0ABD5E8B9_9ACTN|nr:MULTISPECIES: hypothetical protein [unclassified Streptomyces]MDT0417266.1 hypothetical protein [Streptomyces sp. DSM 41982]MDT0425619.1 hypothetical protein [Streptomyces sp. DSM 41859]MYX18809.1 hypothetical protein [Streptomyces sp. SID8380]SCD55694.1 hypothetical protein GA0115246_103102 [Streptomyces sp. SolWspMP-sol7th]